MRPTVSTEEKPTLRERSQWIKYTAAVFVVAILAAVRFHLYYLHIAVLGLIGLLFAIALLRLVFYAITRVVASPGIWIFPNLFADVSFVRASFWRSRRCSDPTHEAESFIPLHE